jgi:hypothetical protein
MPNSLKVGIIAAIMIGFTVGLVGPDHRILKAIGFATGCEGVGCKQSDPMRTVVILGVAAVALSFLAIRPGLKKFLAAVVVIAISIGFFAYTKPGARMLKNLGLSAACASRDSCDDNKTRRNDRRALSIPHSSSLSFGLTGAHPAPVKS